MVKRAASRIPRDRTRPDGRSLGTLHVGQKADSRLALAEPGSTGRPLALFSLLALRTQQDSRRTRGLKSTRLTRAMTMPVGSRSAAILNTGSNPVGATPMNARHSPPTSSESVSNVSARKYRPAPTASEDFQ